MTGSIKIAFNFLASATAVLDETVQLPAKKDFAAKIANGTAPMGGTKVWARSIVLAASTPQEIDLTALTWPDGFTITNFSGGALRGILVVNKASVGGSAVLVGPGATNPFVGPFGGTTPTIECRAGSPLVLANLLGSQWAVSPTAKTIALNPGTTAQTIDLVIYGV